jgi:hypothetical protein
MIVIPQSLQGRYTWVWSEDPALARPPATADEKQRAAFEKRLEVARDTGRYSDVLQEGQQPTLFTVEPLSGSVWRKLADLVRAGTIGVMEASAIVVRLCLKSIENPGIEIETEAGPYGPWAKQSVVNTLDGVSPGIVSELGGHLTNRASAPPGK